jgi:integrase
MAFAFTQRSDMTHPLVRSWAFNWAAEGRSAATMREMTWFVERFEATLDGPLTAATRADCEQFIAGHESKFRANYAWRSLRSFFGFVAEENDEASPMAKVKAPKVPLTEVQTATDSDVARLLRACSPYRTATAARDAAIISLLWATGLRRTELAELRVGDVDVDSMTLVVRKSKSGRSRRVPFDQRTAQHLLRWLSKRATYPVNGGDALWIGKRGPLTSDGIRRVIERRRKRAGVTVSAHAFRRGLAARALRSGVSGPSTSALLGWSAGSNMLARYVRGVQQDLATEEYRRLLG